MPYVVTEACIRCKYMDCVEVCPVDCFYEGENMLVISPDECIDCGVCEPECPAEAIISDTDPEAQKWLDMYEERAAIIQHDGGYSKTAAEQFAFEEVMDALIAEKNLTDEDLIGRYRDRIRSLIRAT